MLFFLKPIELVIYRGRGGARPPISPSGSVHVNLLISHIGNYLQAHVILSLIFVKICRLLQLLLTLQQLIGYTSLHLFNPLPTCYNWSPASFVCF